MVNGKLLCLHGGISHKITDIKAINKIDRFREPPETGILTDILWADPFEKTEDAVSKEYIKNKCRNISVVFGLKPVKALLKQEHLMSLVRAH